MSATLFSEIQRLFERTYTQVGINLEDCLIDRQRCGQLSRAAGASARELSELARTFLRKTGDQLFVGIYYSRWLIEQLEHHDPRKSIHDGNIRCLIAFVEEINHALHAALQALVDTYLVLLLFVAFFRKTQKISRTDRRWLRFHMFSREAAGSYADANLRGRYMETCELAGQYTLFLDALNGVRRVDEIRNFHALDYAGKKQRILALMDAKEEAD